MQLLGIFHIKVKVMNHRSGLFQNNVDDYFYANGVKNTKRWIKLNSVFGVKYFRSWIYQIHGMPFYWC